MDEKFLEFWGNLMLSAARGKRQSDDISNWIQKSFGSFGDLTAQQSVPGFEELATMFRKFYGLDQLPERSAEYQNMAKKASEDFQNSFNDYLGMMGMVSRKDHLPLVEKYEKLKEKCADQEETIKHLRMLLQAKEEGHGNAIRNLQDITKDQTQLFQKMMLGFGQAFSKSEPENHTESRSDDAKEETEKNDEPGKTVQPDD